MVRETLQAKERFEHALQLPLCWQFAFRYSSISERRGKTTENREKKLSRQEQMKKPRKKGTRVRNIETMKAGVRDYEDALGAGETAEAYKQRTGNGKSKISDWRRAIKQKQNQ